MRLVAGVFSIPLNCHLGNVRQTLEHGSAADLVLHRYIAGPENKLLCALPDYINLDNVNSIHAAGFPLLIYGPSGTGKSHLMRSLLAQWQMENPLRSVVVTTGKDFSRTSNTGYEATTTPCSSMATDSIDQNMSLLVDNLEQLAGRIGAQSRLCSMLDRFAADGRPIVAVGRQLPMELPLVPALQSRLSGGLSIPVCPPARAARTSLVLEIAKARSLTIDRSAAELLSDSLSRSFLQLRHAIVQIEQSITPRRYIARCHVEKFLHTQQSQRVFFELVARRIVKHYGVSLRDMKSSSRQRQLVLARGLFIYLARTALGASFTDIGRYLGGRDHSTISHSFKNATTKILNDAQSRRAADKLMSELNLFSQ